MTKFRKLLYAKTLREYDTEMTTFLADPVVKKYEKFVSHLRKNYFGRKEKWAMHVRHELKLPTNNNQTNNLCESSFRILKDILFQRIRCFNLPDLTEMLLTDDHSYFKAKLIDVGNGRFSNAVHNRSAAQLSKCTYTKDQVVFICDQMYMVESQTQEDTYYLVDMRLNYCECAAGSSRGSCKHKIAVMKHYNCAELAVIPVNDYRARALYHYVATGQRLDSAHYRELNQVDIPDDIDQYIEDYRTEAHQDPAALEELEPRNYDDEVNHHDNDDDDNDNLPVDSDREDEEAETEDDPEVLWAEFKRVQETFENKLKQAIHDKNFRKSFKKYTCNVQKVASSQPENMKQHLYAFGQSLGRLKFGSRIPVQPSAEQRRLYPQGGRAVGVQGRRVQDGPKRMRLMETETGEINVHTLPIQKPQAPRQPHNLTIAESRNIANAKKH